MKRLIELFLVLAGAAMLSALSVPAFGQSRDGKITIQENNVSLSKVLDAIEAQTGYIFVSSSDVDLTRKVSVNVKDQSVEQVLEAVLNEAGIKWSISGVNINLGRKAESVQASRDRNFEVTGQVTDKYGPVPGVVIAPKGAEGKAVLTDQNGKYSILCSRDTELKFICLGYAEQTMKVGSQPVIDVVLNEDITVLDETVVVGYRSVKKITMTGSVATVDIKEKENQPIANVSQMFYDTPGVFVNQGGAKPGSDGASITIRGVNSLNTTGGAPLVLLDGVEYDLNAIDPDDIESISVLKDVSAAIYGLKAANGVILVTSKKGAKGKTKVDFRARYGVQQITQIPDMVTDPILYMKMRNLAEINSGVAPGAVTYSNAVIEEYQKGMAYDPVLYPASDWYKICMHNGSLQQYNLRVSGGNDILSFSAGVGYQGQTGIMIGDDKASRLSYDVKVNANVTKWLKLNASYQGSARKIHTPGYGTDANLLTLSRAIPIFANHKQDGYWYTTWIPTPGRNHPEIPTMYLTEGFTDEKYMDHLIQGGVVATIPAGFNYTANVSYRKRDSFKKNFRPAYYGINPKTGEIDTGYVAAVTSPFVTDYDTWYGMLTFSQQLSWTKDFGKHNVHAMVGQEYQRNFNSSFNAGNKDLNDNTLYELNAKGTDYTYATVAGTSGESALMSVFGRLSYMYDERYLIEGTLRCDGSSKLAPQNRWHLFPSVSVAWNINKENFFNCRAIDNLKLRASYGVMGSESVSNYAYFMTVDPVSQLYSFGGQSYAGYAVSALTDTSLGWEKTASLDAGVDLTAYKGRLTFEGDFFYKNTYDIIMARSIPAHLGGLGGPKSNVGTVRNLGFELSGGWKDTFCKDFHYGIRASMTFVRNKVMYLNNGTILQNNNTIITKEGYPIRSFYLLEADGYYNSYDEINNAEAVYGDRSSLRPGYVRYVDQNDDGVIDNDDKIVTKNSIPEITYSFSLNFGWRGLNLDAQFQGVGDCYTYITGNIAMPFNNGAGVTRMWGTDSWTPATKDTATLPIITTYTDAPQNFQPSTQWIQNCKYLRLKNLQLSYTFPKEWFEKAHISDFQIYFSGQNLLTFTPFKLYDPEFTSTNQNLYQDYPNLKTYSVGLNLSF